MLLNNIITQDTVFEILRDMPSDNPTATRQIFQSYWALHKGLVQDIGALDRRIDGIRVEMYTNHWVTYLRIQMANIETGKFTEQIVRHEVQDGLYNYTCNTAEKIPENIDGGVFSRHEKLLTQGVFNINWPALEVN